MGLFIALLRVGYASFFIIYGVLIAAFLIFGVGSPPPQSVPEAQQFMNWVDQSFLVWLGGASFLLGGSALLFARTAPFGIVLLAPSVVFIFFFHLTYTGSVVWGGFWLAGLVLLAWTFRDAFRPLVGLDRQAS